MSVQRIIPVLLHKNGRLVLSRNFKLHQDIGCVEHISSRLKSWDVDELIILDITPHWSSISRDELFVNFLSIVAEVSKNCFTPLAVGGGIDSLDKMHSLIKAGADRVVVNSALFLDSNLITKAAKTFGSQAIIACIDAMKTQEGYSCRLNGGKGDMHKSPREMTGAAQDLGAGEIFIHSVDRDGSSKGYDEALISSVLEVSNVPVIAGGGCGNWNDFSVPLSLGAMASAASNIFSFKEMSYRLSKDACLEKQIEIRPGSLGIDYASKRRSRGLAKKFGAADMSLWQNLGQSGFMGS